MIRCALIRYASNLHESDPAQAVRDVAQASTALNPDSEAQQDAFSRLETASEALPLPGYSQVLRGSGGLDMEALDAAVEAHIAAIAKTPWGRMKGIK